MSTEKEEARKVHEAELKKQADIEQAKREEQRRAEKPIQTFLEDAINASIEENQEAGGESDVVAATYQEFRESYESRFGKKMARKKMRQIYRIYEKEINRLNKPIK